MAYIEKEPLCAWLENMGVSDIIIRRIKSEAHFPTADVEKVVRCEKCKHSRPLNKMKIPEKYYKDSCVVCECEDVVGDEPMIYLGTHFAVAEKGNKRTILRSTYNE